MEMEQKYVSENGHGGGPWIPNDEDHASGNGLGYQRHWKVKHLRKQVINHRLKLA